MTEEKKKPVTAKDRVQTELKDLTGNILAVIAFKEGKKYAKLSKGNQRLLRIQLKIMTDYSEVLALRLLNW